MKINTILLILFISVISPGMAQNVKINKIKALLSILHSDSLTIKMFDNMQKSYSPDLLQNMNDSNFLKQLSGFSKDTNQLNEIKSMLKDSSFMKIYKENLKQILGEPKVIGYDSLKAMALKFMNEDMVDIYDKYYSLEEIEDLINFYKTKTGQKVIFIMPDIQKEVIKTMENKYSSFFIKPKM